MKKWWYLSMFAALTCLLAIAATAAPDAAAPEIAAPEIAPAPAPEAPEAPEVVDAESPGLGLEWTVDVDAPVANSSGVVCTFNCNDGYGFLYYCPDPNMGTCCSQAEPACAAHEGLESGICKKGRLGLPCTPL